MSILKAVDKAIQNALGDLLAQDFEAHALEIRIDQTRIYISMEYDYHVVGRWVREFKEKQSHFSEFVYTYHLADTGSCRFEVKEGDREVCVSFM